MNYCYEYLRALFLFETQLRGHGMSIAAQRRWWDEMRGGE